MKNIKYILSAFLLFISFLVIGDSFMWSKYNFYTNYDSINISVNESVPTKNIIDDLNKSTEEANADYFIIKTKIINFSNFFVTVYGDDNTLTQIKNNENIEDKTYDSLFFGSLDFDFKDIEELDSYDPQKDSCYIASDNYDRTILEGFYGKDNIIDGSVRQPIELMVIMIWIIAFSIVLLMTIYESSLAKKEVVIRLVSGEKISNFVLKSIIKDSLIFALTFILCFAVSSKVTTADYYLNISFVMLLIFLVLNAILVSFRCIVNYKKDIGTKESAKKTIILSYIYKSISGVLLIVSLGLSIMVITQSFGYYSQASFFEQYKDYNFVMMGLSDNNVDGEVNMELYKEKDENYECFSLVESSWNDKKTKWLNANKGSINYLRENIPELENIDLESKFYILTPKGEYSKRHIKKLISLVEEEYKTKDILYEIVEYTGKKNIISFSHSGKYNIKMNESPTIVLNNYSSEIYMNKFNPLYLFNATLFDIDQKEFDLFIKEHELEEGGLYLTSTTEMYNQQKTMANRTLLIGLSMLILSVLFELLIIQNILNFEFEINSSDILLKKILGYNLFERYKILIGILAITYLVGTLGAIFVFNYLELKLLPLCIGIVITGLLEFSMIIYKINKLENANIQKVMKGG